MPAHVKRFILQFEYKLLSNRHQWISRSRPLHLILVAHHVYLPRCDARDKPQEAAEQSGWQTGKRLAQPDLTSYTVCVGVTC